MPDSKLEGVEFTSLQELDEALLARLFLRSCFLVFSADQLIAQWEEGGGKAGWDWDVPPATSSTVERLLEHRRQARDQADRAATHVLEGELRSALMGTIPPEALRLMASSLMACGVQHIAGCAPRFGEVSRERKCARG